MVTKPKVVVLGGGFGGLETAFYLRKKVQDQADITLISDRDSFLYKPNTIYIPFGLDPDKLTIPLDRPTRRKNIEFIQARAREIDPERKVVQADNLTLAYDYLVVATGAGMRPEEIPGLMEHAETIWTPKDMLNLRVRLYDLLEKARSGQRQQVLFLVPPNNKCSGPLYEMVFMLDSWLRQKDVRRLVDVAWSTYEGGFIQAFGPRLDEYVTGEFARRAIPGYKNHTVMRVEADRVVYANEEELPFDLLISFPPYVASTPFPGLPADERGFLRTELATRQVVDAPDIYAVGDAGDFPIKQAFLAFLQSDAAAEHLAARIQRTQPEHLFEPISMCVMEQFDKATFAQVPLTVTMNGAPSVAVNAAATDLYKVGSSPVWRLGKKLLSLYLPWRFNAGEPFHAGLPWQGMEAGLNVMSRVMAK